MSIMFFLILVSLVVALGFLGAFLWATKSGQFEDDFTPSVRILFEDGPGSIAESGIRNAESAESTNSINSTISTNDE